MVFYVQPERRKSMILFNVFICLLSYFGGFKEYIQLSVTVFSVMEVFGKTCLLNQLLQEFDYKNIKYFYENDNYFWNLSKGNILDCDYVILDQFERALAFDNITENIQTLKQLKGKKVVITVRKEYLGDVYKLFDFDLQIQTVWLDYRENEIENIGKYLQRLILETDRSLNQSS